MPTVRTDLAAPRVRRIDDRKNYGDESDAYGLLNPSIFSLRGVYEKDVLLPKPKEEVKIISSTFFSEKIVECEKKVKFCFTPFQLFQTFCNIGVKMTRDDFDKVYDLAASQHPRGQVCVESLRGVLDLLQASEISEKQYLL